MLTLKEYKAQIKKYSDTKLKSTNIYTYLNKSEIDLVNNYYKAYTVELFRRLRGNLRLEVSESKMKELIALKGNGEWEFAGMQDTGVLGNAHCELGHALRYCYYAKNLSNGKFLKFGHTCVGDFFDIDKKGVDDLKKIKNTMIKELKTVISIRELGLIEEHLTYDLGIYGRLYKKIGINGVAKLKQNRRYIYAMYFLNSGLGIPKSLATFLNENQEELATHITPELLGLENLEKMVTSPITLIASGYKDMCELGVLRITDPERANYRGSRLNNYIDFKNLKKWSFREQFLLSLHLAYAKSGITQWDKLVKDVTHYTRKNNNSIVSSDLLELSVNLMNSFSKNATVLTTTGNTTNEIPFKVNGFIVSKKTIKNIDYLLSKLNEEVLFNEIKKLNEFVKERLQSSKNDLSETDIIMKYLRSNLSDNNYDKVGTDLIKAGRDIVLKRKLHLDNMTVPQQKLIVSLYKNMLKIDKEADNKARGVYMLSERLDIKDKLTKVINSDIFKDLDELSKKVFNTVLQKERFSQKQLGFIEKAYSKLPDDVKKSDTNKRYSLKERQDLADLVSSLEHNQNLDEKTNDILKSVLKYQSVTDNQLKYLNLASILSTC